ncbi:MAG: hypothetical protein LBL45_07445, partial [Treponema sp.]|nr:hypothetical protein [Treponema sp.]
MKKILLVFLVASLMLGLTGCIAGGAESLPSTTDTKPVSVDVSTLSKRDVSAAEVMEKIKSPNGNDMLCQTIRFTSDGRVNMRTYIH